MWRGIGVSGKAVKQVARFLLVMLAIFSHTGNAQAIQGGSSTAANSCSNCETQANAEIKVHNSSQHSVQQIELQRCDSLPIIKARVNGKEMPFLLDTAATSFVNQKSFGSVDSHAISVSSWTGTTALNAPQVFIAELAVGSRAIRNIRVPAIDLGRISAACGHPVEGILGADLIQKLGLTIDLSRHVGLLDAGPVDVRGKYDEMEKSMANCNEAFNTGDAARLETCFDADVVLYSSASELHGRARVIEYLKERYLRFAPAITFQMKPREVQLFGEALWYSYDLEIASPQEHVHGHGTAICQHTKDGWQIMVMHNSLEKK